MVDKKQADTMDIAKVLSTKWPSYDVKLSNNELILYALGVGFSQDPLNKDHFKFTYENDSEF
jgi:hypothetical protein